MKILALDSSGLVASVAYLEEDILVAEYTMNYKKTHSQTLLPMLDEIRNAVQLDLEGLDAIAVTSGPGSFTGLRIGSATAKGLGLALGKPLVGVPTLEALAYNLYGTDSGTIVCPMMDARRQQVYTGLYCFEKEKLVTCMEQTAIPVEDLLENINRIGKPVIFLGDGVPVYRQLIEEKCHTKYSFAPAHMNRQRAGAVGALAGVYYKEGKLQDAASHQPEYLRASQAERERARKLGNAEASHD